MVCLICPVTEQKAVGRIGMRERELKAVIDAIVDARRAVVAHWAQGALVFGLVWCLPETHDGWQAKKLPGVRSYG